MSFDRCPDVVSCRSRPDAPGRDLRGTFVTPLRRSARAAAAAPTTFRRQKSRTCMELDRERLFAAAEPEKRETPPSSTFATSRANCRFGSTSDPW